MAFSAATFVFALCVFVASLGTLKAQHQCDETWEAGSDWESGILDTRSSRCACIQAPAGTQITVEVATFTVDSQRDLATGMCALGGDRVLFIDARSGDDPYVLLELCEKNKKPFSIVSSGNELHVCYRRNSNKAAVVSLDYKVKDKNCDGYSQLSFNEYSPKWFHSPYVLNPTFTKTAYPSHLKFRHELLVAANKGINYWFSHWGIDATDGQCRGDILTISTYEYRGLTVVPSRAQFCGSVAPTMMVCTQGNVVMYQLETDGDGQGQGYVGEWEACTPKCAGACPQKPLDDELLIG